MVFGVGKMGYQQPGKMTCSREPRAECPLPFSETLNFLKLQFSEVEPTHIAKFLYFLLLRPDLFQVNHHLIFMRPFDKAPYFPDPLR